MKNPLVTTIEQAKSFDFSPWGGLEGFLAASKAGNTSNNRGMWLKRVVPDLSHAVDMTATAISSLPFKIVSIDGAEEIDTSEDWQGDFLMIDDPKRLLYLLASSLCGGSAYLLPRRSPTVVIDLQYMVPHSITPHIERDGLQWFDRATDQGKFEKLFPSTKQILWFWLPDSDVEIGPALNTPLGNAATDAELILNSKNTMKMYGERGFVPITLLGAKGMPQNSERVKSEAFFDRLLKGGFDVLAKIVNAEALELIKVGAGMDELKGSYEEILRQSREAIATSFGIPSALFMSDNAFASEFDALTRQWYMASRFKQIYQTIEGTFNAQLFKPYGVQWKFDLDSMDIFQEDESERATSLASLVSAIDTNPATAKLGMSILGYELDKDQEALFEEVAAQHEEDKKQEADMANKQLEAKQNQPVGKPVAKSLSPDAVKDIAVWSAKSLAWFKQGKGGAVDWENKHLSEEIAAPIRVKLANAKTEQDIRNAFEIELSDGMLFAPQVKALQNVADAINRAVDAQ